MNTFPSSQGYMSDVSNELLSEDSDLFKTLLEDAGRDTAKHVHGAFKRYASWVDSHGTSFSATQTSGKQVSFAIEELALSAESHQQVMVSLAEKLMVAQDRDLISIMLINSYFGSDTTLDFYGSDRVEAYPTYLGAKSSQTLTGALSALSKELVNL